MKRFVCLCLCALLLTGCSGSDDFVSAAVVVTETEESSFFDKVENWFYDIWYRIFADEKTKAAVDEAVESYEKENGTIKE
ncbi:MAG: hypothetical protein IKY52_13815 [Clostridia bacterium]|nr:hypothetical protein [Clostridia bacterium]